MGLVYRGRLTGGMGDVQWRNHAAGTRAPESRAWGENAGAFDPNLVWEERNGYRPAFPRVGSELRLSRVIARGWATGALHSYDFLSQ
jgi:hypothetical protein